MPHILLTNDDGVASAGLLAMKQALAPLGRVSVIAPDRDRTATARSITIQQPLTVEEVALADGSPAYATDGTPVDCVRIAGLGLLGDVPDLVVSGINLGLNLGDDVTYSGTVAAAFEGVLLGLPAIAVSQAPLDGALDRWNGASYDFRAVAAFGARLVPVALRERFPRGVLLNVNAPAVPLGQVRGATVARLGRRIYNDELVLEETDGARRRYTIYGGSATFRREGGTDFAVVEAGGISVTPLHLDLTDVDGIALLERLDLADLLEAEPAEIA